MGLIKSLAGLAGLAVGGPMGAALAVGATEAAQGGDFKDILGGGLKGFFGGAAINSGLGALKGAGMMNTASPAALAQAGGGAANTISPLGGAVGGGGGGGIASLGQNIFGGGPAGGGTGLMGLMRDNPLITALALQMYDEDRYPDGVKTSTPLQERQLATGERLPDYEGRVFTPMRYAAGGVVNPSGDMSPELAATPFGAFTNFTNSKGSALTVGEVARLMASGGGNIPSLTATEQGVQMGPSRAAPVQQMGGTGMFNLSSALQSGAISPMGLGMYKPEQRASMGPVQQMGGTGMFNLSSALQSGAISPMAAIPAAGMSDTSTGGMIEGPGTGTSDDIPATIYQNGSPVQEARLSDGEFVLREKDVLAVGDGDREKGAARLYAMQRQVG